MLKSAIHALLSVLMLSASAADAGRERVSKNSSPEQLYVECTTVGSKEYLGRQCLAFRAAANKEVAACMQQGASDMQGYRVRYLICVEVQRARSVNPSD